MNTFRNNKKSRFRFLLLFVVLLTGLLLAGFLYLGDRTTATEMIVFVYESGGSSGIYGVTPDGRDRSTFVAADPVQAWAGKVYDKASYELKRLPEIDKVLPHNPDWSENGRILIYKNYRYDDACDEIIRLDVATDETKSIACLRLDAHGETFDWSPDGKQVAFTERESSASTIRVVAVQSGEIQYLYPLAAVRGLAWSPDGQQIAVVVAGEPSLYVYDLDGEEVVWETAVPASGKPTWSPDGQSIAYFCYAAEKIDICISHSQFNKPSQFTFDNQFPYLKYNLQWSPDGQKLLFEAQQRGGGNDIFVMNPDGTKLQQLTFHPADDLQPVWSPDGQQIAFISLRDGNKEIYTIRVDGTHLSRLTNTAGDETEPMWKP